MAPVSSGANIESYKKLYDIFVCEDSQSSRLLCVKQHQDKGTRSKPGAPGKI